jgi:hypothetical protein
MFGDGTSAWLPQLSAIWPAFLAAWAPVLIVSSKQRPVLPWYLYGFACTIVAWPLIALPIIHGLLLQPRPLSPQNRQRQRRADALALLAESSVRSYPSWVAELKRKSPTGVDRGRYAYEHIRPGDSIELVRDKAIRRGDHAVAFRHRGTVVGYVPKRQRWVAPALDDGRRLIAIVDKVKMGLLRRRAKFVHVRIAVLDTR